jgi:hypothetical protein
MVQTNIDSEDQRRMADRYVGDVEKAAPARTGRS